MRGEMKFILLIALFTILINFISAAAIYDELHLDIQTTNSSGSVVTGTFSFVFNISTSSDCTHVIYTNSSTLTTDSRGAISYYLGNINLNFSDQYWLCYYRDGVLTNASKISYVPYAYRARNVTLAGVEVNSNFNLRNYNLTTGYICNATDCFSLSDLNITSVTSSTPMNYSNISNYSYYWGNNINSTNSTQMNVNNGILSVMLSWFSDAWNSLFRNWNNQQLNTTNSPQFVNLTLTGNYISNGTDKFSISDLNKTPVFTQENVNASINQYLANANTSYLTTFNASYHSFNNTLNIQQLYNFTSGLIANFSINDYLNKTIVIYQTGQNSSFAPYLTSSPVFNSLNATTLNISNFLFANGSNVGIGTATPGAKLDIQGNSTGITYSDNIGIKSNITGKPGAVENIYGIYSAPESGTGSIDNVYGLYSAPVGGTGSSSNIYGIYSVPTIRTGAFTVGIYSSVSAAVNNYAAIFMGGNVGIGTSSPKATLEINSSNSAGAFYIHNNSAGKEPYLFVNGTTGNVGIGTATPVTKLEIYGPYGLPTLTADTGIFTIRGVNEIQLGIGQTQSPNYGMWLQTKYSNNGGYAYPLSLNPVGGNVGIGTTSPLTALQVGTLLYVNTTNSRVGIGTNDPQSALDVITSDANYGGVNIGKPSYTYSALNVNGSGNVASFMSNGIAQGASSDINFGEGSSPFTHRMGVLRYNNGGGTSSLSKIKLFSYGGSETAFVITGDNNVGIGTSSPDESLSIYNSSSGGRLILSNSTGSSRAGLLLQGPSSTNNYVRILGYNYATSTGINLILQDTGAGNVGIGTTSPQQSLNVFTSTTSAIAINGSANGATSTGVWGEGTSYGVFGDGGAGNYGVFAQASGAGSYALYCNSIINANGCGGSRAWSGTSDLRLKENISTIPNALNKTLSLRGVDFNWINGSSRDMGFIAQEVLPYVPEVISMDNLTGYYGMRTSQITALLVEAIKEQQKIIISQNGTISNQQQEINTLKIQMQEFCKKDKSYSWC